MINFVVLLYLIYMNLFFLFFQDQWDRWGKKNLFLCIGVLFILNVWITFCIKNVFQGSEKSFVFTACRRCQECPLALTTCRMAPLPPCRVPYQWVPRVDHLNPCSLQPRWGSPKNYHSFIRVFFNPDLIVSWNRFRISFYKEMFFVFQSSSATISAPPTANFKSAPTSAPVKPTFPAAAAALSSNSPVHSGATITGAPQIKKPESSSGLTSKLIHPEEDISLVSTGVPSSGVNCSTNLLASLVMYQEM